MSEELVKALESLLDDIKSRAKWDDDCKVVCCGNGVFQDAEQALAAHKAKPITIELRESLIEAIGIYQGWEESAITMVDECILPVINKKVIANPALSEEELIKLLILKTTSTRYKQNTNGKCWTFVDLNTFAATLIVDIIEALRDAGVLNVRGE